MRASTIFATVAGFASSTIALPTEASTAGEVGTADALLSFPLWALVLAASYKDTPEATKVKRSLGSLSDNVISIPQAKVKRAAIDERDNGVDNLILAATYLVALAKEESK